MIAVLVDKRLLPMLMVCVCLLLAPGLRAQTAAVPTGIRHSNYTWEAKRARLPLAPADAQLPAIVMRDFTAHEYAFDDRQQDLQLYTTEHRIVRVNSADAIERFNKIYIPVQDGGQLLTLKARTISPRGELVEVDQSSIKELKDDDGDRRYKIFAVEGVEKGSEIEYYFTRSRPLRLYGRDYLQGETPARDVTFELISPENLRFDTRVYHGPALGRDTVVAGKRLLRLHLPRVAAVRAEAFANVQAEQMRIEYKLAYNQAHGSVRLFTWTDASRYLFENNYSLSKDENKAVDKLLHQMKVPAAPAEARIKAVEQYLKANFNLDPAADGSLAQVISTRNASEGSFTKLFAALFKRLGIEHELGFTTPRDQAVFDESFDTWNYLDNAVFYFPAQQQWLAPGRPDYRYGMLPAEWTATSGLFVRAVKLGNTESAVGKVRPIPTLTAAQSSNDLDVKVAFSPALDKSTVMIKEVFGGYNAQAIQPYYAFIPEDKRTEAMQEIIKSNVKDATFRSLQVTNGEAGLSPLEKPFTVEATVESGVLLDRAGPRYLFRIGELIGPQSELYQTEERQFDVENDFNRSYHRVITVELPAGYRVRNLADLNLNAQAGPNAQAPVYYFRSGYRQQGQQLVVTVDEVYTQIRWPKEQFEAYRAVINASANFNKVVLVLEKQ